MTQSNINGVDSLTLKKGQHITKRYSERLSPSLSLDVSSEKQLL